MFGCGSQPKFAAAQAAQKARISLAARAHAFAAAQAAQKGKKRRQLNSRVFAAAQAAQKAIDA